ncbi:WYL domain-containing protein [Psychrosphaera sp. 1_MG-2023]|nr:WYL domain-containing protein [Psychrosphaera sp. 1_MG-2023]MDO6719779.1 WYL domain-containing protein [Psychrosphaera sp. 1_MG-2023]
MQDSNWPYRYDLLLRLRLIEVVAMWEGRVNTNHLIKYFGIKRQQASNDIKKYREDIAPNNLTYDKSAKAYTPSASFTAVLTTGSADEYLHLLERNSDLNLRFERLELGFGHIHQLPMPNRAISPEILRPIVKACQQNLRIEVDYRSINDPQPDGRVIAPHSIIYAANRWHVRAFCEKNQGYRDFVLTRFFNTPEFESGTSEHTEAFDTDWNTKLDVSLVPDPRLTPNQKQVIEHDYGMEEGKLTLTVRASLLAYLLKALRIEAHTVHADPKAQQIVVENFDKIKNRVFV